MQNDDLMARTKGKRSRVSKAKASPECGDSWGDRWEEGWHEFFGPIGPFLKSIVGLVFLVVGVAILGAVNVLLFSPVLTGLEIFVFENLAIFLAVMLFTAYMKYLAKTYHWTRMFVRPLGTAAGLVFAIWLFATVIALVNANVGSNFLGSVAAFLSSNLAGFLIGFVVLGYLVEAIVKILHLD